MYRAMPEGGFPIPAVDLTRVDPRFYHRLVGDPTGERPGTVVVDTSACYLYLVMPGGKAMRYGVGLGRRGSPGRAKASSSGCVRLINQDIIDLYDRVAVPSPIFVRGSASARSA